MQFLNAHPDLILYSLCVHRRPPEESWKEYGTSQTDNFFQFRSRWQGVTITMFVEETLQGLRFRELIYGENELLGDVLTTHFTDVSICIYVAKIVIILGFLCVCSGKIW